MRNILEICLSPYAGGLELYMKLITKELQTKAVINKESKLKDIFENENLQYYEISRYDFFKLARIIDREKIDIVHLHWTKDIPVVVLAKLLSKRKPKIVQTRHMHMTRFKDDFYHKFLYKNIDTIIAVTNLVNEQLNRFIPKNISPKIITSYIGANKPKVLTYEEKNSLKKSLGLKEEFIVTIVGRVEEAKGQDIVLKAVEMLKEDGLNIKTLIVGGPSDKKYFEDVKKEYKDAIFTDFVSNPTYFMQISDCLVLATRKETFGLVLIEAMRCNVCVLASNSGGPLEIIEDNVSGLLFETMSSDDLSEKLKLIYEDKDLREKLALTGKEKADKEYDSQTQFARIIEILENT